MRVTLTSILLVAVAAVISLDSELHFIPAELLPLRATIFLPLTVLLLWAVVGDRRAHPTVGLVTEPDVERDPADILKVESRIADLRAALAQLKEELQNRSDSNSSTPEPKKKEPPQSEGDVAQLLALFQERGRLIDFLMHDTSSVEDAQLGGIARVVHNGCRNVLSEFFKIAPIHQGPEGQSTVLQSGFDAEKYRLLGKVGGEPPYNGVVVHRGWQVEKISLPRRTDVSISGDAAASGDVSAGADTSPLHRQVLAPAQVELS